MVDDWIDHTPRDILTKNFGVDHKVFNSVHSNFPYILNGTVSKDLDKAPVGTLRGDDSYVDNTYKHPSEPVPGRLPSRLRNDSTSIRVTLVPLSLLVTPRLARLTPKRWTPKRCQNARIDSISNSGNALMLCKHEKPSVAYSNSRNKTPYTPPTMLKSHALLA
ncbi:hypothetical protein N7489_000347 [Penicillium chrysogenum]|uniref:uncharacterized protein n=1 Tax=Penicillium chrysogenum TaxID=5076 RepID=UPI0024DF09CC|nr:uncharacterized protein N7489_000347 [Penicillium chrysogenum]KAJ5249937.1 hypothetical protein N7489_000347 [Penicillium chrysogenum]